MKAHGKLAASNPHEGARGKQHGWKNKNSTVPPLPHLHLPFIRCSTPRISPSSAERAGKGEVKVGKGGEG